MSDKLGQPPSRKPGRLAARCSRGVDGLEMDVVVSLRPRVTNADLAYLCSVLSPAVMQEFDRRGFDPTTMKFSIDRK